MVTDLSFCTTTVTGKDHRLSEPQILPKQLAIVSVFGFQSLWQWWHDEMLDEHTLKLSIWCFCFRGQCISILTCVCFEAETKRLKLLSDFGVWVAPKILVWVCLIVGSMIFLVLVRKPFEAVWAAFLKNWGDMEKIRLKKRSANNKFCAVNETNCKVVCKLTVDAQPNDTCSRSQLNDFEQFGSRTLNFCLFSCWGTAQNNLFALLKIAVCYWKHVLYNAGSLYFHVHHNFLRGTTETLWQN